MALVRTTSQDTWRATPKLTLNYGLRARDHQPADASTRPATAAGSTSPPARCWSAAWATSISPGNVKNKINWAPRLGITYQINEKTVIREGYGRSYDIGVFGSTFGHSVTQNLPVLARQKLNAPDQLRAVLQPGPGARRLRSSRARTRMAASRLPNGVAVRVLPSPSSGCPTWTPGTSRSSGS